eukprot:452494_1
MDQLDIKQNQFKTTNRIAFLSSISDYSECNGFTLDMCISPQQKITSKLSASICCQWKQQNVLQLYQNSIYTTDCTISQNVTLSILHQHTHRPYKRYIAPKPDNVMGLLFGYKNMITNSIMITNASPLNIKIDQRSYRLSVEMTGAKNIMKKHLQSYTNEILMGCYATSSKLNNETAQLREIMKICSDYYDEVRLDNKHKHKIDTLISGIIRLNKYEILINKMIPQEIKDLIQYFYELIFVDYFKQHIFLTVNPPKQNNNYIYKISMKMYVSSLIMDPFDVKQYEEYLENKQNGCDVEMDKPYEIWMRYDEIGKVNFSYEMQNLKTQIIELTLNDIDTQTILQYVLENIKQIEKYIKQVINEKIDGNRDLGWEINECLDNMVDISKQLHSNDL